MRTLRDLAAPDDPSAWYAASNMWPTKRGTYETADTSTATEITTASTGAVRYAFAARALSSVREYVIDGSHIWQYSGGTLTDRTGGVTIGAIYHPMMAQYGDITICLMGAATATVSSSGGNFAALGGAPQAEIIVVCRNAVVVFNTNTSADGWAASDVGDYTNWATGEAASGRIIDTPGEIIAAVVFGNDIIVFKRSAIYRMSYVGGVIKWQVTLVWNGIGQTDNAAAKYQVAACATGVAFNAQIDSSSGVGDQVYLFDGSTRPVHLNPETSINMTGSVFSTLTYVSYPVFFYDPVDDVLCLAPNQGYTTSIYGGKYAYYSFARAAWGFGGGAGTGDSAAGALSECYDAIATGPANVNGVVQGDYYAQGAFSYRPMYYRFGSTNSKMRRCVPAAPTTGTCSLTSSLDGRIDRKTLWTRCAPILRRRSDQGTDSVSLTVSTSNERDGTGTGTSVVAAESTQRKRFDFTASNNFARFAVTWTDLDVEVDDFLIVSKDAGAE